MVNCSAITDWVDLNHDDRFELLSDVIHTALETWGFEDVAVFDEISDNSVAGQYVPGKGIELNPDATDGNGEYEDDPYERIGVALHEAIHVAEDQMGFQLNHFAVAFLGGLMAYDMFEGCISSVDSVPANLPAYPFQSGLFPGITNPFGS